jgi:hypothetical protein
MHWLNMARISKSCEDGQHEECPVEQKDDYEYPKCQCDCHPGSLPPTRIEES